MRKQEHYDALVARRRACRACIGLCNPSVSADGAFDSAQIGPWTRWQGWLDAPIMVVGQDFSGREYFEKWMGRDQPDNPTNGNLIKLFGSIGIKIQEPGEDGARGEAFFTNAILCLKDGDMQAKVCDDWFITCGAQFLRAQIELVAPRVVVGLGARAHNAVLTAFGLPKAQLRDAVRTAGTRLPTGALLVAVYHCGARVVNITRDLQQQTRDWQRVRAALDAPVVTTSAGA